MNADRFSPWNGLVEQRQMLIRLLRRRCADRSLAEDLAHDTLLRAARYRPSGLDPARVPAWLQRIALNVLNDHLRRECRGPRAEAGAEEQLEKLEGREESPGEDRHGSERYALGEASLCREEALHHVLYGMQRLSDRDRLVLSRAYVAEPGAVFECPDEGKQRKARLFRARRRLRRAVEESERRARQAALWRVGGVR
ncbi:MAG: sigma-70 family RNA polymerase sigma factor [Planctomycetes bacterium]|nr:sigma-70 family RNA polymerase sigma factor [Planctomycetota bacterium]MCB9903081.1 sigma-70 family RNA polymerase sigma factor [Planctomycetota bacterium]